MHFNRRDLIAGAAASLVGLSLPTRALPAPAATNAATGLSPGDRARPSSETPRLTPEQFGADGSATNDTVAVQRALDAANARGGGAIVLSRRYHLSVPLRCPGGQLLMEGSAPNAGFVVRHTGDALILGTPQDSGGKRADDVYLNRFVIQQDVAGSRGAGVRLQNAKRVRLTYLVVDGLQHGLVLGEVARLKTDDVVDAVISGCRLSPRAGNALQLNSGALLKASDNMFNGHGAAGVAALTVGTRWRNWDGAYIYANTFEEWNRHVACRSRGMANVNVFHNIMDRAREVAFDLRPERRGTIHHVVIASNNISDQRFEREDDSVGILASDEGGGRVMNISIQQNRIHHFGKQGIYLRGVEGFIITGNDLWNCASKTPNDVASMHVESSSAGVIEGNLIRGQTHKYGVFGANLSHVSTAKNNIMGALTAATQGVESH